MFVNIEAALDSPGSVFHIDITEQLKETYELNLAPAELKAEYAYTGSGIVLKGVINTVLHTNCCLCLKDVECDLSIPFEEEFQKGADPEEAYSFEGNIVSLDKMVCDQILLNLPARIICKPDCKGLCPVCGTDLNYGNCKCNKMPEQAERKNPFEKLRDLFDENEEV